MNNKSQNWHLYVPKLITVLRLGYGFSDFRQDVIAGLTVAIVALPLAMALGIASGSTPEKGLVTAVVAGFLISALGGSRFQIGGPTGAFVVVVLDVIARHGFDGLLLATALAGIMLVIAGLAGLGTWIKYIPQPVVTGFTAGIAVIIFSTQIKDLLGLQMGAVPGEFLDKLESYITHLSTFTPAAALIAAVALAIIILIRKYAPRWPAFLIAVLAGSLLAWAFDLPVTTIGSQFGELPRGLPMPSLPEVSWEKTKAVLPSAFTIAFLAGVESLLSAVVADGMTGRRHRSNCELVAQGIANFASTLFGGLPATGAIARTATNVRSGARSPVAGMLHAVFLLLFMLILAPLISYVPLATLAAVLVVVAWNMSEIDRFRYLMRAPVGDRLVLLLTFALTVMIDLTVAISVGVVLAAMLFMHRMADAVAIQSRSQLIERDLDDYQRDPDEYTRRQRLPKGVEVFELRGPLFFGVANRLNDALHRIGPMPKAFILILRDVPLVDATGASALEEFLSRCQRHGTSVYLAEMSRPVRALLSSMGVLKQNVREVGSFDEALDILEQEAAAPQPA
ncbi:MAG: SulP family inorganic anion transporter [Gammaproteobacteria bacterium]|nr:sodium-independent anion transporter [Gammaproteobacteria bacterium]